MLDKEARWNLKLILVCQVILGLLCIVVCSWRAITVWNALHAPPLTTVGSRYYAMRTEQFMIYLCLVIASAMIIIDRVINFWLVVVKGKQDKIKFGRRRGDTDGTGLRKSDLVQQQRDGQERISSREELRRDEVGSEPVSRRRNS